MAESTTRKQALAGETKGELERDVDALYRLPLAEFTAGRNALAGRLKQGGRRNEADFVKAMVKPSVSAWAVNQLYWEHREAFDRLMATAEHFRQAQTSGQTVKVAEMRGAVDARREALAHVSNLATSLLRDSGHNPTPDTIWRVSTTLEAMSVYASIPDSPRLGRLTHDMDPPGFDTLTSWIPGGTTKEIEHQRVRQSPESGRATTSTRRKADSSVDVRRLEATRQAKVTAAKVSLQEAKSLLTEARAGAQSLESAQKKANAEAKEAEKHAREVEQRFEKARALSAESARHAQSITAELKQSAKAVEDAKRAVEKASKELEKLFRESPPR